MAMSINNKGLILCLQLRDLVKAEEEKHLAGSV
jgi:hypothetical protein